MLQCRGEKDFFKFIYLIKKIMRSVDLWSKVRCASGMPSFSIGHSIFKIRTLAFESKLSRLVL